MALDPSMFSSGVFFVDGKFDAGRWLDFWNALWSAPSQPGYVTLVRDGLQAMIGLAERLQAEATAIGEATAGEQQELQEIASLLRSVYVPLAASDNANTVRSVVATPLLTRPDLPLIRLGALATVIESARPLRPWTQIFHDEIVSPTKAAAVKVGQIAKVGVPMIAIAIALFLAWRFFGGRGD